MKRRDFFRNTLLAGIAAIPLSSSPAYAAPKKLRWRLALGVPRTLPIWGPGIERFAKNIESLTGGGLKIKVYGAGELVPALETFEAVQSGKIQMGHSAAYYWQGKVPAAPFFTAIPFFNGVLETLSWLQSAGGQELYNKVMNPFGVVTMPCGATPAQMTGWFKKPIQTMEDLKGLKIRVPGLASSIYKRAGASPVLIPGGEVFTSLSTGVIDAVEWVGPYHDYILGLHRAAKYYYGPGWQEQGPLLELMINQKEWNKLPDAYKEAIRISATETTLWMLNEFNARNVEYLKKIKSEGKTEINRLPDEVLKGLKGITDEVLEELASVNPQTREVFDSISAFKKGYKATTSLTEVA